VDLRVLISTKRGPSEIFLSLGLGKLPWSELLLWIAVAIALLLAILPCGCAALDWRKETKYDAPTPISAGLWNAPACARAMGRPPALRRTRRRSLHGASAVIREITALYIQLRRRRGRALS